MRIPSRGEQHVAVTATEEAPHEELARNVLEPQCRAKMKGALAYDDA
jgi:hypothetical protein